MKKLFSILVLGSLTFGALAQDSAMDMHDTGMAKMHHMKKDCVMMKNGKMMVMKHGKAMMMSNSVKLNNGTMVMKDGTVKMVDGNTQMLKEGQYVDMDGKMGMMKMNMKKDKMKR